MSNKTCFCFQGCNKVFSAGLDLVNEIHNCDAKRLSTFWGLFRDMFMQLYNSRLVTIAAVNVSKTVPTSVAMYRADFVSVVPCVCLAVTEMFVKNVDMPCCTLNVFLP